MFQLGGANLLEDPLVNHVDSDLVYAKYNMTLSVATYDVPVTTRMPELRQLLPTSGPPKTVEKGKQFRHPPRNRKHIKK